MKVSAYDAGVPSAVSEDDPPHAIESAEVNGARQADLWSQWPKLSVADDYFHYFPLRKIVPRTNSFIDFFFC